MSGYIKGTVKQLIPEAEMISWETPKTWSGNEIKHTALSEVDIQLDTSRFHVSIPLVGEEPYLVDGINYLAKEGEYFIFNPSQTAYAVGSFGKIVEGLCVFITEETIQETACVIGNSVDEMLDSPFNYKWQQQEFMVKNYSLQENNFGKYLFRIRQQLFDDLEKQWIDWDAFYFDLAVEFLNTHRQIGQQLQEIPSVRTITKMEIYRRLSLAYSYILENFSEPFSLSDLERVAFLSKYYIVRLYRKIYGFTPYQHVLHLRIEKSKSLLIQNHSPSEIAFQLSFSDRRAFSKAFKKTVGISPSQFQKKSGKNNF